MAFFRCKFCGEKEASPFPVVTRRSAREYLRCGNCKAISLSDKHFLSQKQQRERYARHRNFLDDLGYAGFLAAFLCDSLSFLGQVSLELVFDYGSGPNPALIQLLRMVSSRQREGAGGGQRRESAGAGVGQSRTLGQLVDLLAKDLPPLPESDFILGWDPFFSPEKPLAGRKASLVLCLEVAEHFEEPHAGFGGLAACCAEGGHVAVGTLPVPDSLRVPEDFKGWWYKDDLTHVSFYTERAMAACGAACGLEYLGKASPRVFMFRKKGDA